MRPLLVVMRSEGDKELLLDKSRLLRSDGNVTIKTDLTELQREEDKGARDDIDSLNETNPSDDGDPNHWKPADRPFF